MANPRRSEGPKLRTRTPVNPPQPVVHIEFEKLLRFQESESKPEKHFKVVLQPVGNVIKDRSDSFSNESRFLQLLDLPDQTLSSAQKAANESEIPQSKAIEMVVNWFINRLGISPDKLTGVSSQETEAWFLSNVETLKSERFEQDLMLAAKAMGLGGPVDFQLVQVAFDERVRQLVFPELAENPFPISKLLESPEGLANSSPSPSIALPETEIHGRAMADRDDKVFLKDGVRYRPVSQAAQLAQAPRQTILNWIKNKTEFAGRPLQTYYLAPVDRYFVSEESVQRMASRFIKWPSEKPAGPITIGTTENQMGFLAMSDAARVVRVSPRTMWLWASQGKAPTDKQPEVIKCTSSNHFYIREKDVHDLKKLIPRSGLQRGRRPQLESQP